MQRSGRPSTADQPEPDRQRGGFLPTGEANPAALDICTWMRKQGDNPAYLAGQIGEAIEPTTPEKIAATIAKPSYFGQPQKAHAKTYDEIIRDGARGRD